MEKDFFKDRHKEVSQRDEIKIGDTVFICLKEDQPSAKILKDLKLVTVKKIMTPIEFHPRGIKIMGQDADFLDKNFSFENRYGRITYKVHNKYSILTNDGLKAIQREDNILKITETFNLLSKYRCSYWFGIDNYSFCIIIDPFLYVDDLSGITPLEIKNPTLSRSGLSILINNIEIIFPIENVSVFKNGKNILKENIFVKLRNAFNGLFNIDGNSIEIPLLFIGCALKKVEEDDFYV